MTKRNMRIVSIGLFFAGFAAVGGSLLFALFLFTHRPVVPSPIDEYIYEFRQKWIIVYVGAWEQWISWYFWALGFFLLIVGKYFHQRSKDSAK